MPTARARSRTRTRTRTPRPWTRRLWGVVFTGADKRDPPMLIGDTWHDAARAAAYPGEPTRALLFCTRAQARAWCAETLRRWRDGRQRDDIVTRWIVRPVRVCETVCVDGQGAGGARLNVKLTGAEGVRCSGS